MTLNIPHYRYIRSYPFLDADDYKIELEEYKSVRETKMGYWLEINRYKEKFVLKVSTKRYAYPTKKEAFNNFKIRTKRSLEYSRRDSNNALIFLKLIKDFKIT